MWYQKGIRKNGIRWSRKGRRGGGFKFGGRNTENAWGEEGKYGIDTTILHCLYV